MKNLCPECQTIHAPEAACFITSRYSCPECGQDWQDTWTCACNSQCPACGLKDVEPLHIPEHRDMTLDNAFRLILDRARETPRPWPNEFKDALDLVTAYHLLNVKG